MPQGPSIPMWVNVSAFPPLGSIGDTQVIPDSSKNDFKKIMLNDIWLMIPNGKGLVISSKLYVFFLLDIKIKSNFSFCFFSSRFWLLGFFVWNNWVRKKYLGFHDFLCFFFICLHLSFLYFFLFCHGIADIIKKLQEIYWYPRNNKKYKICSFLYQTF